jgi:hypothetical protein
MNFSIKKNKNMILVAAVVVILLVLLIKKNPLELMITEEDMTYNKIYTAKNKQEQNKYARDHNLSAQEMRVLGRRSGVHYYK